MTERDQRPEWVKDLALFSVVVVDLVSYTGAGLGLGYLARKKLGWPWWVLLVTTSAGLVLAFYRIYRLGRLRR